MANNLSHSFYHIIPARIYRNSWEAQLISYELPCLVFFFLCFSLSLSLCVSFSLPVGRRAGELQIADFKLWAQHITFYTIILYNFLSLVFFFYSSFFLSHSSTLGLYLKFCHVILQPQYFAQWMSLYLLLHTQPHTQRAIRKLKGFSESLWVGRKSQSPEINRCGCHRCPACNL